MPQKVLANLVSGVVAFGVSDQHHGFSYEALCIKWDDGEGGDRGVGMSDKKIVPGFGMLSNFELRRRRQNIGNVCFIL